MYPEFPPPPAPSPPRRRWRWVALVIVVVLVCCGAAVGAVALLEKIGGPAEQAREAIVETLVRQRDALLAGDEASYLAVLDPTASAQDRAGLALQFKSLRAMNVVAWSDSLELPKRLSDDLWHVTVTSSPCFVTAPCASAGAQSTSAWLLADGAVSLMQWYPSRVTPHPWQTSELVAQAGQRTIVASAPKHASKLPAVLAEAEKAALVADRFARDGKSPGRYVIYYASAEEYAQWFAWNPPEWSGGAAVRVSDDRYETVLNGDELDPAELDDVLRHELTHASSMIGPILRHKKVWWLAEGLARLAELEGTRLSDHAGMTATATYAKTATGLEVARPADDTDEEVVAGLYGFAFFTARCLSERFGEEGLVEFFHAVVHDDEPLEEASEQVLGIAWPQLEQECLGYIRKAAG